jgi:hypothetical protein
MLTPSLPGFLRPNRSPFLQKLIGERAFIAMTLAGFDAI